ncbi:hypothetical protein [Thiolapillus brandeum]|uniref:Uncharacterized protein n=1 Tax=Thiolapillus brandeum TaxID=1076588 RepID=A0A7U6JIY1_9GAMM|nr:hypothetical protein [Thiolapillus brandeum]BAO45292.1 hypothetical protein TBH_C2382 [Thiolapillus brandeum]
MNQTLNAFISMAAGSMVALISSWLLGYTAAIPMPTAWLDWFNGSLGGYAGLVAWEMLVVQFPGVGLLAACIAFLVVRYVALPWWQACLFIIAGELGTVFLLSPQIISLGGLLLLQHAHETVLIICVLIAGYVSARHKAVVQRVSNPR